jgi:hypothetical protein
MTAAAGGNAEVVEIAEQTGRSARVHKDNRVALFEVSAIDKIDEARHALPV